MHKLNDRKRTFLIMFIPAITLLVIITIFPFIYAVTISLTNMKISKPQLGVDYIGLKNYIDLFKNPRFWNAFKNTTIFSFSALFFETFIGFVLAYLLKDYFKGRQIIIALFIAPMVIPPIVSGLTWRFMYDYNIGFINYIMEIIGYQHLAWLGNPKLALGALIVTDIWQWTPFLMLIILSGLHSLPQETFEAAKVDGASKWQTLIYITIPMLKKVILIGILIRSIRLLRTFDTIYIMTEGGPGISTETMSIHSYLMGFQFFNTGMASAYALIMLIFMIIVCNLYISISERS